MLQCDILQQRQGRGSTLAYFSVNFFTISADTRSLCQCRRLIRAGDTSS